MGSPGGLELEVPVAETSPLSKVLEGSSEPEHLQEAYDFYLDVYLPQLGYFRTYAGKPDTKGYKEHFENFKANMEGRHLKEGQALGVYVDYDLTKCTGVRLYPGRREYAELCFEMASCDLVRAGSLSHIFSLAHFSSLGQIFGLGHIFTSGCQFHMTQKDVKALHRADKSVAAVFLLECSVTSTTGKLRSADVRLSLENSEGCHFLATGRPPPGAEFAAARELDGDIRFEEVSLTERERGNRGMYISHPTFGTMSCGKLGSTEAFMKLVADDGTQELNRLSAVLFVCLARTSFRLRYSMSVSVQASMSTGGLMKAWGKGHDDVFTLDSKEVQLATMH